METVIRVAIVYVFVWACFRIVGKRELTQLSPFELVTLIFIPQLFSRALTRQDYSMTNGAIGASTLFVLLFLTSAARYRSTRVRSIVEGTPRVLVHDGAVVQQHLDRERVALDDILSAMRKVGMQRFADVQWAILESDGKISVVPTPAAASAMVRG
jgi:uncharacterized membrane protein YcaP (DUF421 family)